MSGEGLLDIVTTPEAKKDDSKEKKGATRNVSILSPILTENSEVNKNADSGPVKENSYWGDSAVAKVKSEHNDLNVIMKTQQILTRNLQDAISQKSSKLSQRSGRSGKKPTNINSDIANHTFTNDQLDAKSDVAGLRSVRSTLNQIKDQATNKVDTQKDTEENEFGSKLVQKG